MSITTSLSDNKLTKEINISGDFDFNLRKPFRDAYINETNNIKEFNINLRNTDYLDSSALGMLLLFKEHADNYSQKIRITNVNPKIKELLDLSNFGQIFDIS